MFVAPGKNSAEYIANCFVFDRSMSDNKVMASTKTRTARRTMSAEHKAALAMGREEGLAVRRYLEAIESARPRRGRRRTPAAVQKKLGAIDAELAAAEPLARLHLLQERKDLQAALEKTSGMQDLTKLEKDFVKVAKAYGERKGLDYVTWRGAGVSAAVLQRAGIVRSRI
jgi:hypothetical protein